MNLGVNRRSVPMALAIVILASPYILDSPLMFNIMNQMGVAALACIGLSILVGHAGQISLGHAGFYAIGAYGAAVLTGTSGLPPLVSIILSATLAGVIAWIVGRSILALSGHFLAMATLAVGMTIYIIINRDVEHLGGPDGIPVPAMIVGGLTVSGDRVWYGVIIATLLVGLLIGYRILNSRIGRAFAALSESEITASIAGIDAAAHKRLAFVVAAIYASAAGSLYAFYAGFITPDEASLLHSFEFLIMVLLGGSRSIVGGILGAGILFLLPHMLNRAIDYEMLITGLILLGIVMFLPGGILPGMKLLMKRWKDGRAGTC